MGEALRVPVLYDFASLICYVAHRTMARMQRDLDELGIALDWSPIDLTRISGWSRGATLEGPRRANALRVAADLEVPARAPRVWMDSRPASAVALGLAGTPREPAWRERVFSAIYEEGRSLDDAGALDALDALGRDLGFDAAALCTALRLDAVREATDAARRAEVTGVPTFMLDQWAFGGIQEVATMRSLLGRWADVKRRRAGPPDR